MAVPTVHHEPPPPRSKIALWTHKLQMALGGPLLAVLLALIAGSIIIMITSPGSLVDRFMSVVAAYQNLYAGSFGNLQSTSYSLVNVTSLIFAGLSVAIAFRAGLFNIGAAGQLTVGAVAAGIIGIRLPSWPGWLLIPLMIIASILAGAVWGGIVGVLKAWRGAHEVVTTIMLNWIAFFVAAYLIDGPFQAPRLSEQTIPLPPQATLPSLAVLYNQTLGTFLPQIASPSSYTVDVSLILALLALVVYWFITARTTFGYELRVIGQNMKAARYAGIAIKKNIVLTMALSGAFAALAGSLHLMGQAPYQLIGPAFSTDTTGFDAIGVALLGRTTSIGILLAGLLFGGLQQAGPYMELFAHIPGDLVLIIQALVLFSIATEFLPAIQRALPTWARLGRKPSLVPDIMGHTIIDLPAKDEPMPQDTEPGSVVDEDMIQPTAMPGSQED
ncbi:MAG TPA: ABC transporter permease [Ktedonobacteraceae bacterium]|nr:ABC transporter permease [Ktedonobacteraceae bacterium]